jgi:hypothetical protein
MGGSSCDDIRGILVDRPDNVFDRPGRTLEVELSRHRGGDGVSSPAARPGAGETERRGKIPAMRKSLRLLLNALTALSLVLFIGVYTLWARSYDTKDQFVWARAHGRGHGLTSASGTVTWVSDAPCPYDFTGHWQEPVDTGGRLFVQGLERATADDGRMWFVPRPDEYQRMDFGPMPPARVDWSFPYWTLALATAALPAARLFAAAKGTRRRMRSARGLCSTCGYDLRASPGRCPECGTEPAR